MPSEANEIREPIINSLLVCRFMDKLAHQAAPRRIIPNSAHNETQYASIAIGPAIPQACPLARILNTLLKSTISRPDKK